MRADIQFRFSSPVQTGPVTHPTSYTMGTGSFPGLKRPGGGVDHPPSSSAEVKERVELYLYSPSGPSWHGLGWTLPLPLPYQYVRYGCVLLFCATEAKSCYESWLQIELFSFDIVLLLSFRYLHEKQSYPGWSSGLLPICVYIYIWYDIFVDCNWVDTLWQQYSTHLHTNST